MPLQFSRNTRPDQNQGEGCCDLVSGSLLLTNGGHRNDARYLPLCFLLSKKERKSESGRREERREGRRAGGEKERKKRKSS